MNEGDDQNGFLVDQIYQAETPYENLAHPQSSELRDEPPSVCKVAERQRRVFDRANEAIHGPGGVLREELSRTG